MTFLFSEKVFFPFSAPVDAAPANARTSSSWHDARALKLGERPHRDARAERKSRFFFESGGRGTGTCGSRDAATRRDT